MYEAPEVTMLEQDGRREGRTPGRKKREGRRKREGEEGEVCGWDRRKKGRGGKESREE